MCRIGKVAPKYVIDARMLELGGLQAGGCPKRNSSSLRSEKMGASRLDLGGPSISMAPSRPISPFRSLNKLPKGGIFEQLL